LWEWRVRESGRAISFCTLLPNRGARFCRGATRAPAALVTIENSRSIRPGTAWTAERGWKVR